MLLSVTTRILNVYASQLPVTIGAPRLPFLENQPHLIFNCVSVNRSCVCLCPVCLTPGSAKIPPITSVAGSPLTYHPVPLLLLLLHCTYLSLHSWGCIANHPDSIGDQGLWGEGIHGGNLIAYHLPAQMDSTNEHSWQEPEIAAFDHHLGASHSHKSKTLILENVLQRAQRYMSLVLQAKANVFRLHQNTGQALSPTFFLFTHLVTTVHGFLKMI